MRRANLAIEREKHPIPTVDEIFYKLNKATCFSKLDLKDAFHQIELEEGMSREITTFATPRGLRRYKRLIMGVNSAPEKYHNIISQIFQDIPGVVSMFDDICVYGRSEEEHDTNITRVMDRLRERNLTLNKAKCRFRLTEVEFMGHVISAKGIQPTNEHVKAVQQAERPKNASEVRSFLGLVNYNARYIHDLATIAEPLRKLTRQKHCTFVWGEEQEQSFSKLKSCLTSDTVLGHFSLQAEKTKLICDASNVGLCGILVQTVNGQERVISYAARALSPVEKRYSTTEKEGLSLVWACEKFRLFLLGLDFEILIDHKALEYIYSPKSKPCARIERWILRLLPFNFKVRAVSGKSNIADGKTGKQEG